MSLSVPLHSVWQSQGPSMLLHMALFHSFLWLSNISLYLYTVSLSLLGLLAKIKCSIYRIFFIHSSVDGHWGCLHVLTIINYYAVNTGVCVSFQIRVSSGYMPRNGIAGSYDGSVFSFYFFCHGTKVFNKCQVGTEKHTAYRSSFKTKRVNWKVNRDSYFYFKNKKKLSTHWELNYYIFFFHPCFPTSNVLSNTIIRQCTESKHMTSKAVCYLLLVLS